MGRRMQIEKALLSHRPSTTCGNSNRRTFERNGERIVQRVRGSFKANSGDLLLALAVAGQGVIFQPAFIVAAEIAAGRLEPILEEFMPLPRTAYAVYPSGRFIPGKVRALTEIIAAELADVRPSRALAA